MRSKNEIMYSNLRLVLRYKIYMQCFQVLNSSLTVFSKIVHCNYCFVLNIFYYFCPPRPGEISILILLLELPTHVIKPLNFIRHGRVYNVGFKQIAEVDSMSRCPRSNIESLPCRIITPTA